MLSLDGAFAPASQRGNRLHRTRFFPPERFVAAQLSGGMKTLYKRLGNKKKARHHGHVPGSQTGDDGKFQPCYPVPLLAGRYKFVQVIGQGQSAVLVAAEDTFHPEKRAVAVKVMNLDYSNLGAQEAECVRQLNKADALKVSRTVQLFNTLSFDGHYCLVFELLRPRPLHQYFQRCQFDNEDAKLKVIRKIALQLLQVLGFLKRENVIHADLKPENILIEEGEEIKIKVVDFGNAIHCVHREVSLYYDEFELQTLVYRAPEVMFGVPFGHEIDMWSLGCILAELHIGKPLFLGQTKPEILQEVTSVLGPFPRNPFQSGKFFQDLSEFVGQNPESNHLVFVANMMKKLLNSRNYAFASFLIGLLHYNPSERLSPCQAARHPFVAPEFPHCYLLPQQGDKVTDADCGYTDILLTSDQYISKPDVHEEIKRQHFSGTELLKRGTKVLYDEMKDVHQLSSATKQTKEADIKCCSLETALNTATKMSYSVSEDCSYATDAPITTSKPAPIHPRHSCSGPHKGKVCSVRSEKKLKPFNQTATTPTLAQSRANNRLFKMPDMVHVSPKATRAVVVELERSPLNENSYVSSGDGSCVLPSALGECSARSQAVLSEDVCKLIKLSSMPNVCTEAPDNGDRARNTTTPTQQVCDVQSCSPVGTSAARTRIYCRKLITSKTKQDELSPELKRSKLGGPEHQEHSLSLNKRVKSEAGRKQVPPEQDSDRAGSSKEYQDDVVILL